MATRRLLSLLGGTRNSSPFNAACSSLLSRLRGSSDSRSNTSQNQWRFIGAVLLSSQAAVFLTNENKFAFAQDDSSNELTGENVPPQGQNQESHVSDMKRPKDGTVVSNEHIAKWRLYSGAMRNLYRKGKLDAAEKACELALKEAKLGFGPRDPNVGFACFFLAEFKKFRNEFEVAEPLYLEAISIFEESLGPDNIRFLSGKFPMEGVIDLHKRHYIYQGGKALHNLGLIYLAQQKLDQACTYFERSLKIILSYKYSEYASDVHYGLASVLYMQGKNKDAEAHLRESISLLEAKGLAESPTCISRILVLYQILLKSNRPAEAENLQRKILHALELSKSLDSLETAQIAEALTLTLQSLGNLNESEELLEKRLEVKKRIRSEDHIQVATTMLHLARSMLYGLKHDSSANGKYSDARDDIIKAKKLLDSSIRIMVDFLIQELIWIVKASLRKEKSTRDHIHEALLLYLQALHAVVLLESIKHEMLSPEGMAEYQFEAEHALRECILILNEPQLRSVLLNAPDAKVEYLTCLNRFSILIGESGYETTRKKELKDLIETGKRCVLIQPFCLRRRILSGSFEINFSSSFYFWR